VKECG